jgi:hypothetical protein
MNDGAKYPNELGFQKRVKGYRVPFRFFAVAIDIAHFHQMFGLAASALTILGNIQPGIFPKR